MQPCARTPMSVPRESLRRQAIFLFSYARECLFECPLSNQPR